MLLAFVAAVAVGASLALLLAPRPPGDDSAEAGFARDMMVHHAQAVEMAEILRDKTESDAMRTLAKDIVLTQQNQIGQMQGWLAAWGLPATGTEPAMSWLGHPVEGLMPGMATPEEMERLFEAPPEEADALFLLLMIPHHEAGIPMAEAVLKRTDRPEVRQLAEAIALSQRQEIELMSVMLRNPDTAPVGIDLKPAGDSSVSGSATFAAVKRGVEVKLQLRNLPGPNTSYLAQVHPGSCGSEDDTHQHGEPGEGHEHEGATADEIEYPLTPVESDAEGEGSSTTVFEGVTLDRLLAGAPKHLNVHAVGSDDPPQLACANLG
jgi:uncharacterized protein (DUF305 family)